MTSRTKLVRCQGQLRLEAPLAIGAGRPAGDLDRPLLRDRDGNVTVPVSSLLGVLRGLFDRWARAAGREDLVDLLFGEARGETGRPSPLRVIIGPAEGDRGKVGRVRDGVGLERARGAARDKIKYDFEVSDDQLSFPIEFEVDLSGPDGPEVETAFALLLDLLDDVPVALGGRTATGLGAVTFELDQPVLVNLTDRSVLRRRLLHQPLVDLPPWRRPASPPLNWSSGLPDRLAPQVITFELVLRVRSEDGPLFTAGRPPYDGDAFVKQWFGHGDKDNNYSRHGSVDGFFQFRRDAKNALQPLLPGSSLRGALRSHAERILRTLAVSQAGEDIGVRVASDPLERDPNSPVYASAFAMDEAVREVEHMNRRSGRDGDDREASRKTEALVWDRSDLGSRLFGSSQLASRVVVGEAAAKPGWKLTVRDHVAVDRYTSGAAEQKLFNLVAVEHADFPVRISCHAPTDWMVGLLLLLMKDLHDGLIGVGGDVSRGYGMVRGRLERIRVAGLPGSPLVEAVKAETRGNRVVATAVAELDQDGEFLDGLPEAWRQGFEVMVGSLSDAIEEKLEVLR